MDRRMKFFVALLGGVIVSSALADDAAIGARMTCADINAKISELSAVVEPDTDVIDELTKLKADYRRSCSRAARGRKSSAGARVVIEASDNTEPQQKTDEEVVEESSEEDLTQVPEEDVTQPEVEVEEVVVDAGPTEDEILAMELANLDAGLCVDGTKPNKFGCCEGELFKDLGNAVFACCPKEGDGECFPPIK